MEESLDYIVNVKEERVTYKDILKEIQFLKVMLAHGISRFGDGIDTIAFSWLVYQVTGSTMLVATLYAVNCLPNLIFGMTSGVACNYMRKKTVMAICDLGRGVCVAIVAILFFKGSLQVWHLYLVTFLNSSFESFRGPAAMTIRSFLISKEKMDKAVGLNASITKMAEIGGIVLAPILITIVGLSGAIIIDSVTFFLCALIVSTLKYKDIIKKSENVTIKEYSNELIEGFKYVKNNKFIMNLCIFGALVNFLAIPLNAFEAVYVKDVLHKGTEAISFINVPFILGMTLGGILVPIVKEFTGGRNLFIIGGTLSGIGYLVFGILGMVSEGVLVYLILAVISFILGLGMMALNMTLEVSLINKTDSNYLSRVASILTAIVLCTVPIGSSIVGIILYFISIKSLFIIFSIILIISFIGQFANKNMLELNS